MSNLLFTSRLAKTYHEALVDLFFHNANQTKMHDAILAAIEHFGTPSITTIKDRLWITFDSGIEAQSLFVLEKIAQKDELVGIVIYTRKNNKLVIIFTAVREDYAFDGHRSDRMLLPRLMGEVINVAHHIKGISFVLAYVYGKTPIRLPYKRERETLDTASGNTLT